MSGIRRQLITQLGQQDWHPGKNRITFIRVGRIENALPKGLHVQRTVWLDGNHDVCQAREQSRILATSVNLDQHLNPLPSSSQPRAVIGTAHKAAALDQARLCGFGHGAVKVRTSGRDISGDWGGCMGQLGPNIKVIIGAQVAPAHRPASGDLDRDAIPQRDAANLPVANGGDRHTKKYSHRTAPADGMRGPIKRVQLNWG